MFSTGKIIFALFFLVAFVAALIWGYRKDRNVTKVHFKKSYLILLSLILTLSFLFLIVKIRKLL
jgi:hypothetical membrane protein